MAADPQRIQFVARRFHELQGLPTIVFAGASIGSFWLQPYIRELRYAGPSEALVGLLVSFAPFGAALTIPAIRSYYRRRFGRVSISLADRLTTKVIPLFILIAALNRDFANTGAVSPGPHAANVTLIAGAALALHVAIRDWPWRRHHLFAAAACGLGAWLMAAVPSLHPQTVQEFTRVSLSWLLAAYAVTAYLDHRLLITTMPRRADMERAEHASDVG